MFMKRIAGGAIATVFGLVALGTSPAAATVSPDTSGDEFSTGTSFAWSVADDPGSLNPVLGSRTVMVNLMRFLYDPLVHSDPEGNIISGLATSWEVTDNVVTFQLDPGVTCSDGTPVTPTTVADFFEYLKDPEHGSTLIGIALPNRDYEVAADDASGTFTLTLADPYLFILPALEFLPIPCGAAGADPSSLTASASGSGPYTLTEVVPDDHYTLTRRDDYAWGPDGATTAHAPETARMDIVASETTAANLLLTDELNAAAIAGQDRERLLAEGMEENPYISGGAMMIFNQAEGRITADPDVRTAIVHGIDRTEVATVLTQGLSSEVSNSLSPAQPQACVDTEAGTAVPASDPEGANALLDAAGWVPGSDGIREKDGQRLSLVAGYLSTYAGNLPAIELMAEQLADIGVELVPVPHTQATWSETLFTTGDFDVVPVVALSVPFQSALYGILAGPFPPDGINGAHVDNPEFKELATEANQTTGEAGCQMWIQAEQALFASGDVAPMAGVVTNWVTNGASFDVMQGRIIPTSITVEG